MNDADDALLTALRAGDDRALAALLSRHAPAVYRFGLKMCGDPEDAKDVLQETLIAAARGIRDFRGASSVSTWLYTVARSFCIKQRRRSKFAPESTLSLDHDEGVARAPSSDIPPDEALAGRELRNTLDRAIAALDPAPREVLILRDIEGLTAPEVAKVLGVSAEAVKSRLHRARADLRRELETMLPPAETSAKALAGSGCPDITTLFSQHLEGEIGPALCQQMEVHIAACTRCHAACESLKRTLATCQAEQDRPVPPEVQELVRRAVSALKTETR